MLQKTSLNVIAMHIFPTKFDWIIIELSKAIIRPWMNKVTRLWRNLILCLSLAKDKKIVQVTTGNISMFDKTFGKKKGSKRAWNHRSPQRNYMNHKAKKMCEISFTLFYCSSNYIKLHVYQCIILEYQCIRY